jgi:hypothetical protein
VPASSQARSLKFHSRQTSVPGIDAMTPYCGASDDPSLARSAISNPWAFIREAVRARARHLQVRHRERTPRISGTFFPIDMSQFNRCLAISEMSVLVDDARCRHRPRQTTRSRRTACVMAGMK